MFSTLLLLATVLLHGVTVLLAFVSVVDCFLLLQPPFLAWMLVACSAAARCDHRVTPSATPTKQRVLLVK